MERQRPCCTRISFQSSPALSGRCNYGVGPISAERLLVSILTGPFGPVQHATAVRDDIQRWFQSSPALSGRCNNTTLEVERWQRTFQSSPALSGRCNARKLLNKQNVPQFQSSPALSGRCNFEQGVELTRQLGVSILTGPFGPVQPERWPASWGWRYVSILTGPFGPVQRMEGRYRQLVIVFQSSPALSGRCNRRRTRQPRRRVSFNPHRPFRAGATRAGRAEPRGQRVSILTGPFGPVQPPAGRLISGRLAFQSSPALSGRCNPAMHALRFLVAWVSILTGPFGPVQRQRVRCVLAVGVRFNPHRPFRAGAT